MFDPSLTLSDHVKHVLCKTIVKIRVLGRACPFLHVTLGLSLIKQASEMKCRGALYVDYAIPLVEDRTLIFKGMHIKDC